MSDDAIKKRMARAKAKAIDSLSQIGYYIENINGPSFDIIAAREREWRLIIFAEPDQLSAKAEKIKRLEQIPALIDRHGVELVSKEIWLRKDAGKKSSATSRHWITYSLENGQWITQDGQLLNVFRSRKHIIRKQQSDLSGHVYFILNKERNLIKIGHTKDIQRRCYELKANNLDDLEILHSIKTNNVFESEKKLHEHFAQFRIRGEWFKHCEEILRFIELAKKEQDGSDTE